MFFQGWEGIDRTGLVGLLGYVGLVSFLRISGKRTLAKLNAFDLVVTVALGFTLSALLLQKSIPLADGLAAFAMLILLQFVVTFLSVRLPGFADAVRSEPSLLVRNGKLCLDAMRRERVTESGVLSAIRATSGRELDGVVSLILESDGSLSVVTNSNQVHGAHAGTRD